MCTLCKVNKQFAAINIQYFETKKEIPALLSAHVIQLKDKSYLALSIDKKYFSAQLEKIREILLSVLLIIAVIFTIIMLLLNKKIFYPLKCLVSFCHNMTEAKDAIHCPSKSYEIEELRIAILGLLERNKALYENKSNLFKEIAHEPKSPIAIMQAHLSLLMEDNLSKDTLPTYIDETNADIEDIKRLIYELLFLEEIELDMQNTKKSDISMKGICEIMQNKFQPLLKLNDIQIDADWSQDFSIYSFEHSILKVMQAIYENIAVHAQKGSIITMKVNVDKKSMTITNLYQENEDGHFHSTNIGTKIIQRLSNKLNFTVETAHNDTEYITIITFQS
ncbi:MAG: HAMP domain-containing histidine kinase [Epsilonproteobacteria bacterium]|nr:HAMP domain-containing histidine kinase [Campylobacterota bacterium]